MPGNKIKSMWNKLTCKLTCEEERIILLFLLVLFLASFFFFFPAENSNNSPVVKIYKRDGEPLVEIIEEEE